VKNMVMRVESPLAINVVEGNGGSSWEGGCGGT
jgi:hypothetical protein